MTLDKMRNEQAAQEYEEWDNQESFKVGWDACLKALIEMGEEFPEREAKEEHDRFWAVKGRRDWTLALHMARWTWSLAQPQVWALKAEIKRLNDKYDIQLNYALNAKDAEIKELKTKLKEAEGAIERSSGGWSTLLNKLKLELKDHQPEKEVT